MTTSERETGGWAMLLSAEYRSKIAVMAGGILLFATNVFITSALLPSAVAEIGGRTLYGWAMTAFLVPAVIASLLVGPLIRRYGARAPYQVAFGVFAAGSLLAALAPTMAVLLAGRAVQGVAGGLLAGLGYAVIRRSLPASLWSRALGLVSAMWGVGNLTGPTVGGLFAELGWWRLGMVVLLVVGVTLAAVARRSMSAQPADSAAEPFPVGSLLLISASAVAVSVAGVLDGAARPVLFAIAIVFAVAFVLQERRTPHGVLPKLTYRQGNPLKWVYLSIALLAVISTAEAFIPLFGQELGGLGPLVAGLLGAALSWGWSSAGIATSNVDDQRTRARLRVLGPALLATGFGGYALLQGYDPAPLVIVGWFGALVLAGAGIGMAFQHSSTAAMSAAPTEAEATRAATGVPTVQLMANAIGSALAGALVNLGGPDTLGSAHTLLFSFALLAVLGVLAATRANVTLTASAAVTRQESAASTESAVGSTA